MSWKLFVRLFHVDVPEELLVGLLFLACVGSATIIRYAKHNRRNKVVAIWAVAYIVLMLWITVTVLSRLDRAGDVMRYNLMPLWSIDSIKEGYVETMYEKVYNVLFFVPLGLITAFAKSQWWKLLLFGFGTSVTIELLQLVTRTGMCETDDVICNTAGFAIGFSITRIIIWCANGMLSKYKRVN